MAGPRKKAGPRARQVTRRQAGARRGPRPDPILMDLNQFRWNELSGNVDHERFDYHFFPPGQVLNRAKAQGWKVVEAEAEGSPTGVFVAGGETSRVGEPVRGMGDQYLCRREKRFGERQGAFRRAFIGSLFQRMGHKVDSREWHREVVDSTEDPREEGLEFVGVDSKEQVHVGEDPYPPYQEQP